MKTLILTACAVVFATFASAQTTFEITGAPIPSKLLQQNYGRMPKGIAGYDLSVCNVTDSKQSIVSSRIYQALEESYPSLLPIGRQIMLASILHNQNHSIASIIGLALTSTTGVLSVLASSHANLPVGLTTSIALGALSGQQLLSTLSPVLSADNLENFDSQVLESALVLDSGSCVERTLFVTSSNTQAKNSQAETQPLSFHVR